MATKHFRPDGMKCAKPGHALHRLADNTPDALPHFSRGLVGEGNGQYFGWPCLAGGDQMRQPCGQRGCLASACSGKNQHRTVSSQNGLTLRRSEEHTSELQSLMRLSYDVLCLKQNN